MAGKLNLSNVVKLVQDDDSDWELSEDELVDAENEGEIDSMNTTNPLDKAQDNNDDTSYSNEKTNSETQVPDISPTTPVILSHSMETVPGPAPTTSTPLQTSPVPPTEMDVFMTEQCIASTTQQGFLSDQPPFMKKAGSLLPLDETDHPCEFFEAIFGSNTFDHIATQTNLYASQFNATWEETSSAEIKALLGDAASYGGS